METSIWYITICFFLMLQFGLNRGLDKFKFVMDDTLQGFKCLDEKKTFEMVSGKSACALRCWMDIACSSMVYYPDTGKCTGCTSFTGVTDPSQSNSLFYKRKYQYLGCYGTNPRILIDIDNSESSSLTTEWCVTHCRNMDASFSLTEYSYQCFCGASVNFTIAEKVPESNCSYYCSGNASQICGGAYIGSLYRTGV